MANTANKAQKFLLDNNCGDLILNDHRTTKPEDRIYASDIMMMFLESERGQNVDTSEGQMAQKQSEHQTMAVDMGNRIIEFDPNQQNEMLRTIRQIVVEHRELEIEKTEKQLAYLKDTFHNLHT